MSPLAQALLAELTPDDLAELARRLAPFLPAPDDAPAGGDWLTLREAARHLRIGYSTAKRYAADGTWPVEREGGRCYVRRADLDAWRRQ